MTLEQACSLLVYPRVLGKYLDKDVELCKAKSVYLRWGDTNYSLEIYMTNNPGVIQEPESITLEKAIAVVETINRDKADGKLRSAQQITIPDLADAVIKSGPYGFYIKYLDQYNVPLPMEHRKDAGKVTKPIAEAAIAKFLGKGKSRAGGVAPKTSDRPGPSAIEETLLKAAGKRAARAATPNSDTGPSDSGPSSASSSHGSSRGASRGSSRGASRGARTAAKVTEGSIAPIPTGTGRGRGRGRGKK